MFRPMFGAMGRALYTTSLTFLSTAAVSGCRTLTKADIVNNDALPNIEVDSDTYEVRADGELLKCEPAQTLPMAQRYFLF